MSSILFAVKDPDAILTYTIDWTPELAPGDTIRTSTWTPDAGINVLAQSLFSGAGGPSTGTAVTLGGGTVGDPTHVIVNHITTVNGMADDQTLYVDIWEK